MNQHIMAICDREESYVSCLSEYLKGKKQIPFEIQVFTGIDKLISFCGRVKVHLLIIGEGTFSRELQELPITNIVLLREHGLISMEYSKEEHFITINKYQSSEAIYRELMRYCAQDKSSPPAGYQQQRASRRIGIYTPVGRCLQTSFSFLLGQVLAKKHHVLYLNFENYSGFGRLVQSSMSANLTDLLYYMKNQKEKFFYQLNSMVQTVGGLDYISPVFSFFDLHTIQKEDWLGLLAEIEDCGDYDYIILDISEGVQGIFEILRGCERIYTITREDGFAVAKIEQYERLLTALEYEDILEKTKKWKLPVFRSLPSSLEQLPFSDLADYVRMVIQEDLYA